MVAALLRTGQFEALGAPHHPAVHHHPRELGMELDAPGLCAIAERLVGVGLGRRQQGCALWQRKPLAMKLIDHLRPVHQGTAFLRGAQGIPADLHLALIMRIDTAAQMVAEHLGAEADAEKRLLLARGTRAIRFRV